MRNNKFNNVLLLLCFFALMLGICSCVTKRLNDNQNLPPNVRTYYHSKGIVWKQLIQIIKNEFLMPFDFASYKRGYFTCQEIKSEEVINLKYKYRLSGSITFDGSGTVVSLFKYAEIWDETEKAWKNLQSDYLLETEVLDKLSKRLKALEGKR